MFGLKTIAVLLLVAILFEACTAAPVNDGSTQTTQKSRHPKNPQRPRRKNLNTKVREGLEKWGSLLDKDTVQTWKNPCNSISWEPELLGKNNYNVSYQTVKNSAFDLHKGLAVMDKINASAVGEWEELHKDKYEFLPTKPEGKAEKWHGHMQIYVASFSILARLQSEAEERFNNKTVSPELQDIFERARSLLCDIEHFVNSTSNRDGKHKPYLYKKWEMAEIINFQNKAKIDNIFLKARFQEYIGKLYERIKKFNLEANLNTNNKKSLKSSQRKTAFKSRRKGQQMKRRKLVNPSGEVAPTENFMVVRTSQRPKGQKKHNRKQQRLEKKAE